MHRTTRKKLHNRANYVANYSASAPLGFVCAALLRPSLVSLVPLAVAIQLLPLPTRTKFLSCFVTAGRQHFALLRYTRRLQLPDFLLELRYPGRSMFSGDLTLLCPRLACIYSIASSPSVYATSSCSLRVAVCPDVTFRRLFT